MVGPLRNPTVANIAAVLAVALAAAALVVALGAEDEVAAPGAPGVVDRARAADEAERAGTAREARRAESARTAASARRAETAERLRGVEGRRLADASRRAGGVRRPKLVKLAVGKSATALTSGPFRVRIRCSEAPQGGVEIRVSFASTHEGSLVSVTGTPGAPIDEGGRTLLNLRGDKPLWSGGRSFSLASPKGSVVEGVFSYGINQLGSDCVASAAGLS